MALVISEDWIRDRVQLKRSNLEDVRSLSLPGTYHEKISVIGSSLRHFTRLKCLDLSRNAISSLEGLDRLKMLEKLNLYYNCVPRLEELYRLRHNETLQELDLRLNPVARNEPDYRIFLVHLLPSLRRLDDRAVGDSERKAALMHFNSDQAAELVGLLPVAMETEQVHPRPRHVRSLAHPPAALDDADMLMRCTELKPSTQFSGSVSRQPAASGYPPSVAQAMDRGELENENNNCILPDATAAVKNAMSSGDGKHIGSPIVQPSTDDLSDEVDIEFRKRYPNLAKMPSVHQKLQTTEQLVPPRPCRVQFADDANLQFADEIEAYTSYKAQGFFTPNPSSDSSDGKMKANCGYDLELAPEKVEIPKVRSEVITSTPPVVPTDQSAAEMQAKTQAEIELDGVYIDLVRTLSMLVDKYWNGTDSLLKNQRFQRQMVTVLENCQLKSSKADCSSRTTDYMAEIELLTKENEKLREQLAGGGSETEEPAKWRPMLARAQRDVSILRTRLEKSMEENRSLQEALIGYQNKQMEPASICNTNELEKLAVENEDLRRDIAKLTERVQQTTQANQLSAMLQESHKSLVQTNEHLLREIEDNHQRHLHEVKQLNWSYDQLKRSVSGNAGEMNGPS